MSIHDNDPVIVEALRTPVGKKGGVFSDTRADDLGAMILRALLDRTGIDPKDVGDVVTGCVTQTGEQGLNISRNIALAAGLPIEVTGASVNRLCGSGLQAAAFANATVAAGYQDVAIALGAESMTRVPMGSDGGSINPAILDRFAIVPQGISAELIAEKWDISREVLDQFSLRSHQRALAAIDDGRFAREVVPVAVRKDGVEVTVDTDETPRRNTSAEKLASLQPVFKPDGVITAGNSSQISDGAAGVVFTTYKRAKELGLRPRARIVTSVTAGVDPTIMLTGPIPSTRMAVERAGLKLDDMTFIECNEAFAPVPVAMARELGIDLERINPRGGAIALGHPLGSTGTRLLTTLLHTLEDEQARYGLVTLCIGFGQGISTVIERL